MSRSATWKDFEYADTVAAAMYRSGNPFARLLLLVITFLFVVGIFVADRAYLDEVTRGDGRFIPSGKAQIMQSLEGGLIDEILVREGQTVEKGQVLLRIDDAGATADFGELITRKLALDIRMARLAAEANGAEEVAFPEQGGEQAETTAFQERMLFETRQANLESQINILREQVAQKSKESEELRNSIERLTRRVTLIREEKRLKESSGVVPRVQILPLDREINETNREIENTRTSVARVESEVREIEQRMEEQRFAFKQDVEDQISRSQAEIDVIEERLRAARDRVIRTDLRSPVDGVISTISVNTIGGVIGPGADILEIVPLTEGLLVEARVRPQDIAFIAPGQTAKVRVTAYDFSIYGAMEGEVERVGADSRTDDATGDVYFPVTVRTNQNALEHQGQTLPVKPGMVATVDVLTGSKSILDYVLKPLRKARYESLSER